MVSEERDSDAGILMRERPGKGPIMLADLGTELFHRGWLEVQAEVSDCTAVRSHMTNSPDMSSSRELAAYVVGFTYVAGGKSYEGILNSPSEVEKGDKFTIRYDPRHPEKNSTFDSETAWTYTYTAIFSIVMLLPMTALFIWSYFFRA